MQNNTGWGAEMLHGLFCEGGTSWLLLSYMSLTLLFNFFLSFSEKIIWIWDSFQKCLLVLTDQNTSAVPASWGVPEPNTSLPGLLCETPSETSMHEQEVSLDWNILSLFVCLFISQPRNLTSNSRPGKGTSQSY